MKVYLAGAITGLTLGAADDWRKEACVRLQEHGITPLSPLRAEQFLESYGVLETSYIDATPMVTDRGIMTRDHWDVSRCDAVLFYLRGAERVSIGTMFELAWAHSYRKPTVVVMEPPCSLTLSTEKAAWFAAWIDGEGYIGLNGPPTSPTLSVEVKQRDLEMVKFAADCGIGYFKQRADGMWLWRVTGNTAADLLRVIFPYLKLEYKRAKAALGIEMMEIRSARPKRTNNKSPAEYAAEADIQSRAKAAQLGESVPYLIPARAGNPHEHSMVREATDYRVDTLDEAIANLAILKEA